jgi:hypothetical protein
MEWLITGVVFLALQYWIWKSSFFKAKHFPVWFSNALFTAKALGGIALFFIYTLYYTNREQADIFKFYDDGITLRHIINENPNIGNKLFWGDGDETTLVEEAKLCNWRRPFSKTMLNENRMLIRFHTVLSFITFGMYQLHNLLFCWLAFLGIWLITKTISPFFSQRSATLWAVLLFFPSVVLWADGLLKESVLLFALGVVVWMASRAGFSFLRLVVILIALLVMAYTRTILAVIVVVAIGGFWASTKVNTNRSMLGLHAMLYVLLILIALVLPKIDPLYDYFRVIAKKQYYTYEEAKAIGAKSLVELPRIDKRPISVITTVPLGFFYALLQPTPLQAHGKVIVFINGVENLLFVLLFVYLLLKIQKQKGDRARLFWFLFFIAAVYLSFIGLLVPVLGNMVRYKAVVIPLLMASLLLLQKEQSTQKN